MSKKSSISGLAELARKERAPVTNVSFAIATEIAGVRAPSTRAIWSFATASALAAAAMVAIAVWMSPPSDPRSVELALFPAIPTGEL